MKKALPLLMVLVLSASVAATTVESQNVVIDLEQSSVSVRLDVAELTTQDFTYVTNYPIQGLEAGIAGERRDCTVKELKIGSEVRCSTNTTENFTASLNYTTSGLSSDMQNVRVFRFSQLIYRSTDNYSLRVLLPKGYGVVSQTNISQETVSPPSGSTGSTGQRIFVEWDRKPGLGETMDFQVFYEPVAGGSRIGEVFFWVVAIVLGGGIVYVFLQRFLKVDIEDEYSRLSEDEKEVIELMKDRDGSILQKDLVEESGYSKAKVSGIVSELVDKEIIRKEKEGRSNKLFIGKRYSY